jgi:hypothetical protein
MVRGFSGVLTLDSNATEQTRAGELLSSGLHDKHVERSRESPLGSCEHSECSVVS